jgi:E3 ubiquitin-protein ligase CCNP1IP1
MKCNGCWKELENENAFITSCSHIFCENDARKIYTKDRSCPLCDTSITSRSSITGVELIADDSKVLQLCGLSPKEILEICSKSISFWSFQKQLEMEYQKSEAKKKSA